MDRREFMQSAAAAAVAAAVPGARAMGQTTKSDPMVGMQVGAVSFLDEGVEETLDVFQKDGVVNTLFVATFTYGRGIAGRQVPGQPLPDHGKQQYDANFRGGSYTRIHAEFYRDTSLKEFRAPE